MKTKIIVWGADNHNALGLLRQLAVRFNNLYFANTGRKRNCASASRYCYNYLEIPTTDRGIAQLIELFKDDTHKAVLIPSGDEAAETIDKNNDLLRQYFYTSGTTEPGLLTKIDDKNVMSEIAERHGFIIPKSKAFSLGNTSTTHIRFPAILKPVICKNGIREFKFRKFNTAEDLHKFEKFLTPGNVYILQEYIPKTNDIVVYGVRLHNGTTILAGQYVKDRWSDDGGGSHGGLYAEIPEYLNPNGIEGFLAEIDYHGLFSVEFGLYNGIAYFYEFNLRNDATSHLFYQSGANLPVKWSLDCIGSLEKIPTAVSGRHENINELYDITNVFKCKISLSQYLSELKRSDVFYFKDREDIRPYKKARIKALYDVPFRAALKVLRPYLAFIINKLH